MHSILFTIILAVGGTWASALPLDYGCDVIEENEIISGKSTTELACESYVNQSINGRSKYAVRRIFSGMPSRRNEFPHMVSPHILDSGWTNIQRFKYRALRWPWDIGARKIQ